MIELMMFAPVILQLFIMSELLITESVMVHFEEIVPFVICELTAVESFPM